jgi:hypothetical protein
MSLTCSFARIFRMRLAKPQVRTRYLCPRSELDQSPTPCSPPTFSFAAQRDQAGGPVDPPFPADPCGTLQGWTAGPACGGTMGGWLRISRGG